MAPGSDLVDRLMAHAEAAGWPEVCAVLHFCRVLEAGLAEGGTANARVHADAMLQAAEASGRDTMVGLALACRAGQLVDDQRAGGREDDLDADLARAVALLEGVIADGDLDGDQVAELPAAFVECGQAYHRRGLWELEEEMYQRAAWAVEQPVDEPLRPIAAFTERILLINRAQSAAALTCDLLDVDLREQARQVAVRRPQLSEGELALLPAEWVAETLAVDELLRAVAGEPTTATPETFEGLDASVWSGYRACLELAQAIRAQDAGDLAGAGAAAERSLELFDNEYYLPSVRTFALRLAMLGTPADQAARRYADHLAGLRWHARRQVLGSARSRLAAARVLRESEQLTRKAYVDQLTGLGNRHAHARQLSLLRAVPELAPVAVILIDVDRFKSVNDTFGHAVGDAVLRVVGAIVGQAVRASDFAARLGGDEFMLLIGPVEAGAAEARAHAIVASVASYPWDELAAGLQITISAGQAAGVVGDVDAVTETADARLYQAKAAGRGRAVTAAPVR